MKRCATCNRTYTDPNLSFCIDDGTPLTVVPEDDATVVSPRDREDAPSYQPPGGYEPPPDARHRRVWPWVVGILGSFVLGILVISIAAAIIAPRLRSSERDDQTAAEPASTTPSENSNAAETINSNSDTVEDVDAPPPADHDQVLAQLTDLEHEWTVANINADKRKLERILADDYVGPTSRGDRLQGKAEYIRTIRRDTRVERWEFTDLKLVLLGDRATLSGKLTYVVPGEELHFDFTDKFVWRDGRWQATGSEVRERE